MIYNPSLDEWNWFELMLHQALIGAISDNMELITLEWTGSSWLVEILLTKESKEDVEEAEEIQDRFADYLIDINDRISKDVDKNISVITKVSAGIIKYESEEKKRTVFMRRK